MWEPRRLTTLWAFTACYRDTFTFSYLTFCYDLYIHLALFKVVSFLKICKNISSASCMLHAPSISLYTPPCALYETPKKWDAGSLQAWKGYAIVLLPRLMQTELLKMCWVWLKHCLYPIRSGVTQQCRAASGASGGGGGGTKLEANRHTQPASEILEFTVRTGSSSFPCPGLVMSHTGEHNNACVSVQ
jgi:hypothetical protein